MEAAIVEAGHGWRHMVGLVTGVTRGRVETRFGPVTGVTRDMLDVWTGPGQYVDTISGCAEECGRDS